jgi:hypothetical protein
VRQLDLSVAEPEAGTDRSGLDEHGHLDQPVERSFGNDGIAVRNRTRLDFASRQQRLLARPKPRFSGEAMTRAWGNRAASISMVPSVDALSATMTSKVGSRVDA